MVDFDLDLQAVEEHIETDDDGDRAFDGSIVLGVLDGTTPDEEWAGIVENEDILLLCVEGDINELAAGFAREVVSIGGDMVHFRGFLLVTPPGVHVDNERLKDD